MAFLREKEIFSEGISVQFPEKFHMIERNPRSSPFLSLDTRVCPYCAQDRDAALSGGQVARSGLSITTLGLSSEGTDRREIRKWLVSKARRLNKMVRLGEVVCFSVELLFYLVRF